MEESKSPGATSGQYAQMTNTNSGSSSLPHNMWLDASKTAQVKISPASGNFRNITFDSLSPNNVQSCLDAAPGFGGLPIGM